MPNSCRSPVQVLLWPCAGPVLASEVGRLLMQDQDLNPMEQYSMQGPDSVIPGSYFQPILLQSKAFREFSLPSQFLATKAVVCLHPITRSGKAGVSKSGMAEEPPIYRKPKSPAIMMFVSKICKQCRDVSKLN